MPHLVGAALVAARFWPVGSRAPTSGRLRPSSTGYGAPLRHSLLLLEILQIRRRLILLRRHQEAVLADIVVLLADQHVMIAVGALRLEPDRLRLLGAFVFLGGRERTRQR